MLSQKIKIIIIWSLILKTIDAIHTLIDPTIAMCIDGEVDTAFLTKDGKTYLFMNSWFWKLNSNLSAVDGNATLISDYWPKLPQNIETSFHISGDNALSGRTIFIKNPIWFSYINQVFDGWGRTDNWTDFPSVGDLLPIAQHNDPIVVFYLKHDKSIPPKAFYFDNYYFPDGKDIIGYDLPFDTQEVEALVSYPDGKYLVFFDDNRIGGHCLMNTARSGCSKSRLNSDLFECPDFTKNLFQRNLFIRIWFWSGLGLKQFGILMFGILLSLSFILLFVSFILSMKVRKQYLRKFSTNSH